MANSICYKICGVFYSKIAFAINAVINYHSVSYKGKMTLFFMANSICYFAIVISSSIWSLIDCNRYA